MKELTDYFSGCFFQLFTMLNHDEEFLFLNSLNELTNQNDEYFYGLHK